MIRNFLSLLPNFKLKAKQKTIQQTLKYTPKYIVLQNNVSQLQQKTIADVKVDPYTPLTGIVV